MASMLTVPQVAAILAVSESTLARWRRVGDGPPFRTRGLNQVLYDQDELTAWCDERRVVYDLGAIESDAVAEG